MTDELELFRSYIRQLLIGNREIVANTSLAISRYLHRFGGHRLADPENLQAEALAALVHNLQRGTFRGGNIKQFNAYLRSIVLNTVLKAAESEARLEPSSESALPEATNGDEFKRFADKDVVEFVLGRLNSSCRELLTLKYLQDLDNSEIAEKLGLREGTVRVRIHRCTEGAKEVLRDNGLL